MGTLTTITKNLILSRRIPKDEFIAYIESMDADKDGYITVRELLDRVCYSLRYYGEKP